MAGRRIAGRTQEVPGCVVQDHLAAGELALAVDVETDDLALLGGAVGIGAGAWTVGMGHYAGCQGHDGAQANDQQNDMVRAHPGIPSASGRHHSMNDREG